MDEDTSTARRLLATAYLALCLIYMAWMVWHLIPEHRRQAAKLRLLRWSGRETRTLARRTGAASIRQEALTGKADYAVTYRLSLWAEWLSRAYDQARNVTT